MMDGGIIIPTQRTKPGGREKTQEGRTRNETTGSRATEAVRPDGDPDDNQRGGERYVMTLQPLDHVLLCLLSTYFVM
ncbi:hypothetical protein ACRALDRAFT_2036635, partial [Sodiomyces alcalophilus JCM 7366]|uniref:uncharacterized protein n=1 Tax=Sodiomyces alcalophilus JCM 7366 TaxID=591952 RepID=UPI0039B421C8